MVSRKPPKLQEEAHQVPDNQFELFAQLLALAAALGIFCLWLRQPLVIALVVVGLVAGPEGMNLIHAAPSLALFSHLGVTILLYLVGLRLDIHLLRTLGRTALTAGILQVALTTVLGIGLCLALGLGVTASVYVGLGLSFSSTIIVVKLLTDRRELGALHGRLALGILIVQDLLVVVGMLILGMIGPSPVPGPTGWLLLQTVFALLVAGLFLAFFISRLANPLLGWLSHQPELLSIFALAMATVSASLCHAVGLSMEIGGLLAGVALASTPYREVLFNRLSSLRDFLLIFFFIELGTQVHLDGLASYIFIGIALLLFVMVVKPLLITALLRLLGYQRRTGFLAAMPLGQLSEFSLILMVMGLSRHQLSPEVVSMVTVVGLVSIALCSYPVTYAQPIYNRLARLNLPFLPELPAAGQEHRRHSAADKAHHDVIMFGLGHFGLAVGRHLRERGLSVLAIDFDPQALHLARHEGFDVSYGDAGDRECLENLALNRCGWVLCTLPPARTDKDGDDPRLQLLKSLKALGYGGRTAFIARDTHEAHDLHNLGVDVVLQPFNDAAIRAVDIIVDLHTPQQMAPGSV